MAIYAPTPSLAYVALAVRNVDAVAAVFGDTLGLARVDRQAVGGNRIPIFPVGEAALALFDIDDPLLGGGVNPGLHHIGFNVDDPVDWAHEAGFTSAEAGWSRALAGDPQVALDTAETVGLRMVMHRQLEMPSGGNGLVERIDHLGVASHDNRRAIDLLSGTMGFSVESQQTDMEVQTIVESFTSDKYGVIYKTRPPVPVGGLRVAFVTIGDCELEFLQNFDPSHGAEIDHGQAGTTKQDQGAITRFIERRGAGLHHLALKTPAIDEVLAALAEAGLRMIDHEGRPGSRRARIGFVHPAALGGVLLHFVERDDR